MAPVLADVTSPAPAPRPSRSPGWLAGAGIILPKISITPVPPLMLVQVCSLPPSFSRPSPHLMFDGTSMRILSGLRHHARYPSNMSIPESIHRTSAWHMRFVCETGK